MIGASAFGADPDGGLSGALRTLIATLALPCVRFHDWHRGHAMHLPREGVHPTVVSERLTRISLNRVVAWVREMDGSRRALL